MLTVVDFVLKLCEIFVVIQVLLTLLAGYGIASSANSPVTLMRTFFNRILDPVLSPLRAILPELYVDPAAPLLVLAILIVRYALALYPLAERSF